MTNRGDKNPARQNSGVGLCLAGGGYPGAGFEFGAVAALDAGLDGWNPARSSVIVGTSCGAVVGAVLALGVEPADVRRALEQRDHPLSIRRKDFSNVPWSTHARAWTRMLTAGPRALLRHTRRFRVSWEDVMDDLHPFLPTGAFSNVGLENLLERASRMTGCDGRFTGLAVPLAITATDLDTGDRAVFGHGWDTTPCLSLAVRASTAIPAYFEPVRIGDRDLIDGQIVDPLHLDLSATAETRVVMAVSPLVPYRRAEAAPRVRTIGATAVLDQSGRIAAAVKLRRSRARFKADYPDLPVFAIEPEAGEVMDLLRGAFRQRSLAHIWELGFRSAARCLANEKERWASSLNPLGIQVNMENLEREARNWNVAMPS
jgi:predicted acylesterase/phospholipase RssA